MTLSITSNGRACCERSRDVELAGRGGRFATTVIERLALIFATNGRCGVTEINAKSRK
jgi:hypothetical protein